VAEIITRQKQIVMGRSQSHDLVINKPESNTRILEMIKQSTGRDPREQMIVQEVIVYLYMLMRNEPESFKGLITLRPSQLVQLITGNLADEKGIKQDEAFEIILNQSPSALLESIKQVIKSYQTQPVASFTSEFIRSTGEFKSVQDVNSEHLLKKLPSHLDTWHQWRKQVGVMPKLNESLFEGLWLLLNRSHGVVIGDRYNMNNRLETNKLISNMTYGEQQFSLLVEYVYNQIEFDDYRQLNIEAIWALITFAKQNPELQINDYFVIEVIISHAVRLAWLSCDHEESRYGEEEHLAWDNYYNLPPKAAFEGMSRAIEYLMGR
ncbi:MAG: hypothetical protein HRU38_26375, partial [Saccharospirillaceae bacterium]|nr:glycoside hydrolase family 15 protein [Pseudomonadales bacterium]NRB82137.1 hypothetical protein [Saccharospirillaceae bacterium]